MVKLAALARRKLLETRQPLHQKGWRRIYKLHVLKEKVGVTETLLPFLTGEGFLALPFETFLLCAKKKAVLIRRIRNTIPAALQR